MHVPSRQAHFKFLARNTRCLRTVLLSHNLAGVYHRTPELVNTPYRAVPFEVRGLDSDNGSHDAITQRKHSGSSQNVQLG